MARARLRRVRRVLRAMLLLLGLVFAVAAGCVMWAWYSGSTWGKARGAVALEREGYREVHIRRMPGAQSLRVSKLRREEVPARGATWPRISPAGWVHRPTDSGETAWTRSVGFGWPCCVLYGRVHESRGALRTESMEGFGRVEVGALREYGRSGTVWVPRRVNWAGVVVNAAAYAALPVVFVVGRRELRRWRGRCLACGYDLRGLERGAVCPECGVGARVVSASRWGAAAEGSRASLWRSDVCRFDQTPDRGVGRQPEFAGDRQ